MALITVNLPRYYYEEEYDRSRFLEMFPDSFLATTFTDPSETEVDLVNPLVTPYVLQYIQELLRDGGTPPSPKEDLTLASRYLLMPILAVVSDPLYPIFQRDHPSLNLVDISSLKDNYGKILTFATGYDYMPLLTYLWDRVDFQEYPRENLEAFVISANKGHLPMFQYLRRGVPDPTAELLLDDLLMVLGYAPFDDLQEYISDYVTEVSVVHTAALGSANAVLTYLSQGPTSFVHDSWDQALYIAALSDNYDGVDIIRPLARDNTVQELLQEEINHNHLEMVRHLFLPLGEEMTNDNLLIRALEVGNDDALQLIIQEMNPSDILSVLQDHLDLLRNDSISIILSDRNAIEHKPLGPRFITNLYALLRNNGRYELLPEFEDYIDKRTLWTNVLGGIKPDVLEGLLDNDEANYEIPDSDYLLNIATTLVRPDLIPVLQAYALAQANQED